MRFVIDSNTAVSAVGVGSVSLTTDMNDAGRAARSTHRRNNCVTFITLFIALLLAAPLKSATTAPLPPLDGESLVTLLKEIQTLNKSIPQNWFMGEAPAKNEIQKTLIPQATRLMERLLTWPNASTSENEAERKYREWSLGLKLVFRIQTEFINMDATETFNLLDAIIARFDPPDATMARAQRARAVTELVTGALSRWYDDSDLIIPRLLALEKTWIEPLGQPLPGWWLSLRVRFSEQLYIIPGTPEQYAQASRWIKDYLNDQSTPIRTRAFRVCSLSTSLYGNGDPDGAATILEYAKNIPEGAAFVENPDWLRARFFVAQMGHGDRVLARSILESMDGLISLGKMTQEDGCYLLVIQNYYNHLSLPDIEHQKQVLELRAERRELEENRKKKVAKL